MVVRGRLNLLTPGLGFSDALTGRENIMLGGLANGMSPERLADIADEIAEFAQLEELPRPPDALLLRRDADAAGVVGRRVPGSRDPAHRRGAHRW